MACTSPMYRIPVGSSNYFLLDRHDQERAKNDGVFFYDLNSIKSLEKISGWDSKQVQVCRCGQCVSCKLVYARDWAIRCSLEASLHEHNYFITLTYDDLNLPKGEFLDYSGTVWESNLCPSDVQKFLKNLREWERTTYGHVGTKVFYCGEYGSLTGRPHYHLCIFGCVEIPDLSFSFKKGDHKFYKSALYESFWSKVIPGAGKVLRGFVDISECSFDTVAYTARYCMKKVDRYDKKMFLKSYDKLDDNLRLPVRQPPFIRMSNRPGIAADYWLANNEQIREEDVVKYQKRYELFKSKPPRYFDRLFDRYFPDEFSDLKVKRSEIAYYSNQLKKSQYSELEESRMKRENDILESKQKNFPRGF